MIFDTIVVGAGIEGSATAYHLAKSNRNTLLLEQFLLPHTRGSSHGQSRIIRKAYVQQHYADMMNEAYEMWHTLEEETQTKLFQKTGLLVVARPPRTEYVTSVEKALAASGAVYQKLTSEQINKQFPMMKFNAGDVGVFEKDAGVLFADKALQAYHKMFVKYGGTLHDGEPVMKIIPGELVTVETSKGKYQARSVVITAGPWTNKVVKPLGLHLPLKLQKIKVCYWRQQKAMYGIENGFPAVATSNLVNLSPSEGRDSFIYTLPAIEYPLHVKICNHYGQVADPDDPDTKDFNTDLDELKDFVRRCFRFVESKPSIVEKCFYTLTPDDEFILDNHPKYQNIIIGAGFSGHGFKLAPMVGKLLSELASNRKPHISMHPFMIKRFEKPKSHL